MVRKIKREMNRRAAALGLAMSMTMAAPAMAEPIANELPTGGKVQIGDATIGVTGSTMDINQTTNNVLIDWNTFNVGQGNTVNFYQPNVDAVAVNRVLSNNPSEIYGNINSIVNNEKGEMIGRANVTLINPYGINVYNGAQIDVGSFIASTHDLSVDDYKKLFPDAIDTEGNIVTYKYERYTGSTYEKDVENWYKMVDDYEPDKHYTTGVIITNVNEDLTHDGDHWGDDIRVGKLDNGKEVYYIERSKWKIVERMLGWFGVDKFEEHKVEDLGKKIEWEKVVDATWKGLISGHEYVTDWHYEYSVVDDIKNGQQQFVGNVVKGEKIGSHEEAALPTDLGAYRRTETVAGTATDYTREIKHYETVTDKELINRIDKGTAGEGYKKTPIGSTAWRNLETGAGAIYNGGNINAQKLVALVARDITNTGTIEAANVYLGTMGKDFPTAVAPTTPASDSTPAGSIKGWILGDDLSVYNKKDKKQAPGQYLIHHYAVSVGETADGKKVYYIDAKDVNNAKQLSHYKVIGAASDLNLTKIGDFKKDTDLTKAYVVDTPENKMPGNEKYYTPVSGNAADPIPNGDVPDGNSGNGENPLTDDVTSVFNSGTITATETVAAEAMDIENVGDITAHDVYLGKTVSIGVDYKINVAADAATIAKRVYNSGEITANGGTIVMAAKDAQNLASDNVGATGVIQAGSLQNVNGTIELAADNADIQVLGYVSAKTIDAKATGGNITVRNMLEASNNVSIEATNTDSSGNHYGGKGIVDIQKDATIEAGNAVDLRAKSGRINIEGDIKAKSAFAYGKKITVTSDSDINAKSLEFKTSASHIDVTNSGVADNVSKIDADAFKNAFNKAENVTLTANYAKPENGKSVLGGDIYIDTELNRMAGTTGTLSINASRNVKINEKISSQNSALNVKLNAAGLATKHLGEINPSYDWQHKQTDGRNYVNADISTNGGNVEIRGNTIISGDTITFNTAGGNVVTGYNGTDGDINSAVVGNTNLTIDTRKEGSTGGDIKLQNVGTDSAVNNITITGNSLSGKNFNAAGNADLGNDDQIINDVNIGDVIAGGRAVVHSHKATVNAGDITANGGEIDVNGIKGVTVGATNAKADNTLTAADGSVRMKGATIAGGNVTISAKGSHAAVTGMNDEGTTQNIQAGGFVDIRGAYNVTAGDVQSGTYTRVEVTNDLSVNNVTAGTAAKLRSENHDITTGIVTAKMADAAITSEAVNIRAGQNINVKGIVVDGNNGGNVVLKSQCSTNITGTADGNDSNGSIKADGSITATGLDGKRNGHFNAGTVTAGGELTVKSGSVRLKDKATAAKVDIDGYNLFTKDVEATNDTLSMKADYNIETEGDITAKGDITALNAGNQLSVGDVTSKEGAISAQGAFVNVSDVNAKNDISIIANGAADASNWVKVAGAVTSTDGNVTLGSMYGLLRTQKVTAGKDILLTGIKVDANNTTADGNVEISGETVTANNTKATTGKVAMTGATVNATHITAGTNIELEGNSVTTTGAAKAGATFQVEAGEASIGTTAAKDILIQTNEDVALTGNQTATDSLKIVAGGDFTGGENSLSAGNGWKVYLAAPGNIVSGPNSNNLAQWGTQYGDGYTSTLNQYVFQKRPTITITPNDFTKQFATISIGDGVSYSTDIKGQYIGYFTDGTLTGNAIREQLLSADPTLASDGFAMYAPVGDYDITVANPAAGSYTKTGYEVKTKTGTVTVDDTDYRNSLENNNLLNRQAVATSNAAGRGLIQQGAAAGTGVDRVLGLTEGTLTFNNVAKRQVVGSASYEIKVTPDAVQVTKAQKQGKKAKASQPNQYRALGSKLSANGREADFNLTYDGASLDIYPTDDASKAMLQAGAETDNADVIAKALHTSFNSMGIELEDLDGVTVHLDATEAESK